MDKFVEKCLKERFDIAKGIISKHIGLDNLYVLYNFGSRVYGTYNTNSDWDYIAIVDRSDYEVLNENDTTIHVYTVQEWINLRKKLDIQTLESEFLDSNYLYKHRDFIIELPELELDKWTLRKEISTIASNSWVKGKKKLIMTFDYDLNLAIKSVFHSLRILEIGIQLAGTGQIINYSKLNYILPDLWRLSQVYKREELWNAIDSKYRKLFNSLKSEFIGLCPKNSDELIRKNNLKDILKRFGIDSNNTELINELLNF